VCEKVETNLIEKKAPVKLSAAQLTALIEKLPGEPSDTKLAIEFGVHRKSVWRVRQAQASSKAASVEASSVKSNVVAVQPVTPIVRDPSGPDSVWGPDGTLTVLSQKVAPSILKPPTKRTPTKRTPKPRPLNKPPEHQVAIEVALEAAIDALVPPIAESIVEESIVEEPVKPILRVVETIRPPAEATPPAEAEGVPFSKVVVEAAPWVYFAIESLRGENFKHVTQIVLEAADKRGILFRRLQVLDIISVGAKAFVRFRADMANLQPVVNQLKDRGVIHEFGGGYVVHLVDGRKAKFSMAIMCSVPKAGFGQLFVGTRIKRWKQQFPSISTV